MEDAIVLYPCPLTPRRLSMIELGKLIVKHDPSIKIIIIVSSLPNQTLSSDPYIKGISLSYPSISFVHLPTLSLPEQTLSSPQDYIASVFEVSKLHKPNLHQTLSSLSKLSNIKALVLDFFSNEAFEVPSSLGIPTYYFFSSGASGIAVFLYYPVIDRTIKESLKDLDILLDIPGLPKIPSKDMPLVMLDKSLRVYKYFVDAATQMAKSAGLVLNTFELLEEKAIKAIREGMCTPDKPAAPPLYCIGPFMTQSEGNEEQDCLLWLDSQPQKSVVFLCFGGEGVFSAKQLKEMAVGLERSGVRFLWVVRDPNNTKGSSTPSEPNLEQLFPEGFMERTKGRGFVVKSWAPQVAVLNHNSVGGFVTHCGWKSVMEALGAGVPLLAWPLYAEQKMNRVILVEELKIALAVEESDEDGFVSAAELELRLTELLNSDKGKAVAQKVMAMRDGAVAATSDGGSSRVAIANLVRTFKQSPH
ncbi:hypothetical protein Tsubulata_032659 [Turnera subulata]|uniref:Glycosyltransferase n=1 Tax=Turnera subulata TaxID=218843 RepID=A0A9Q0FUI5_9ROSI|nr:hypothetical protein Tsubulata_032659 [Turnera subulata]